VFLLSCGPPLPQHPSRFPTITLADLDLTATSAARIRSRWQAPGLQSKTSHLSNLLAVEGGMGAGKERPIDHNSTTNFFRGPLTLAPQTLMGPAKTLTNIKRWTKHDTRSGAVVAKGLWSHIITCERKHDLWDVNLVGANEDDPNKTVWSSLLYYLIAFR
jgi:hypothetical protein